MTVDIETVRKSAARAATNPALWPETLWRVGNLLDCDMTLLEHVHKADGRVEIGYTDRPDLIAAIREPYEQHYWSVNPRWTVQQRMAPRSLLHDDLIGDERTLDRLEFYADLLMPLGLKYFIGSLVIDDADEAVILSLQRSPKRGRMGAEDLDHFGRLLPDLVNAIAMYLRLGRGAGPSPLASAMDRLADPIAILRADGRLLFANRTMSTLIAERELVRLDGGRITGGAGTARAFDRAIRSAQAAAGCGLGCAAAAGPAGLVLFRAARLAPEESHAFAAGEDDLYCLIIDDPARPRWRMIEEAMRLYGLTRCEAGVGAELADGRGVDEIAGRLGISRNTVRTHVAMLREKLGVKSSLSVASEMRRADPPFA
jgi:DNA-binding CsgD family transcriptional regulator